MECQNCNNCFALAFCEACSLYLCLSCQTKLHLNQSSVHESISISVHRDSLSEFSKEQLQDILQLRNKQKETLPLFTGENGIKLTAEDKLQDKLLNIQRKPLLTEIPTVPVFADQTEEARYMFKLYLKSCMQEKYSFFANCGNVVMVFLESLNRDLLPELSFELLYDSDIHPKTAKTFHDRVDQKGPTATFIKSQNNYVCAVTRAPWSSKPKEAHTHDPTTYLLRCQPNPARYDVLDGTDYTAKSVPNAGPLFGTGGSLRVDFCNPSQMFPFGLLGSANDPSMLQKPAFSIPKNNFLFATTDGTEYSVDRFIVIGLFV